jgi:hypothetical protein
MWYLNVIFLLLPVAVVVVVVTSQVAPAQVVVFIMSLFL